MEAGSSQSWRVPYAPISAMPVRTSGIRQPSIWASVVSDDALRLRDWLLVLGFTEDLMIPGETGGSVHHCQLDWPEGGRVLLSSSGERSTPCRPGTSSLHVVTSDPDAVIERALSVGASEREGGSRQGAGTGSVWEPASLRS